MSTSTVNGERNVLKLSSKEIGLQIDSQNEDFIEHSQSDEEETEAVLIEVLDNFFQIEDDDLLSKKICDKTEKNKFKNSRESFTAYQNYNINADDDQVLDRNAYGMKIQGSFKHGNIDGSVKCANFSSNCINDSLCSNFLKTTESSVNLVWSKEKYDSPPLMKLENSPYLDARPILTAKFVNPKSNPFLIAASSGNHLLIFDIRESKTPIQKSSCGIFGHQGPIQLIEPWFRQGYNNTNEFLLTMCQDKVCIWSPKASNSPLECFIMDFGSKASGHMQHLYYTSKKSEPHFFGTCNHTDLVHGKLKLNSHSFSKKISEFQFSSNINHSQPSGFKKLHFNPTLDLLTSLGAGGRMKFSYRTNIASENSMEIYENNYQTDFNRLIDFKATYNVENDLILDFAFHPKCEEIFAKLCSNNILSLSKIECSSFDDSINSKNSIDLNIHSDSAFGCEWDANQDGLIFLKQNNGEIPIVKVLYEM